MPYYWAGIKLYDIVSGSQRIKWCYFVNKTKALEQFPHLKKESLAGAIVYYDGKVTLLYCSTTIISSNRAIN